MSKEPYMVRHITFEALASERIERALSEFREKGFITARPINVGEIDQSVANHAKAIGNPIASPFIYFTNDALEHSQRDSKLELGIAVPEVDMIAFPKTKSKMSIYYDSETRRYTYTDYVNKFILQPNVRVKLNNGKESVVSLVTASKMRATDEFNMRKYKKIK